MGWRREMRWKARAWPERPRTLPRVVAVLLAVATPAELTPPVGVVCFGAQAVPGLPGMLPYATKEATGGVEVTEVWNEQMQVFLRPPTYPLRVGDLITHVEGIPIRSRDAYIKMVFEDAHIGVHPRIFGEPVRVTYRREEQSATETIVLAAASTPSIQLVRPVSYRYTGFVSALATDLPVRPEQCGAPVVDSQGHVVGILIARAPYVETLVLPAREVLASLEKMNQQAKALP